MNTRISVALASALAVAALVAAPLATAGPSGGDTPRGKGPGENQGKSDKKGKRCKKATVKKAFFVKGKLVIYDSETKTVDIIVDGANSHAKKSGEIKDQNGGKNGIQVKGAPYTVEVNTEKTKLMLPGDGEEPEEGDKVRIKGKIELTKKKCAEEDASLADRYGEVTLKKVKIITANN